MFHEYKQFLVNLGKSCIHVFLHHNADPDAVCAAEAIGHMSSLLNPQIEYKIYTDGLNFSSKRIVTGNQITLMNNVPETHTSSDFIITVDTGNFSQLGKFESWVTQVNLPIIVFDHHENNDLVGNVNISIYDRNSPSTCILLARGYKELELQLSTRISTLLLCGHIYDSRRFIHGSTAKTFRLIAFLIDFGGDFDVANEFLQNEMAMGERIARLKAARRLDYKVYQGKNIVVTSQVGAFESSAARSLINIGADTVFVIAVKANELRGSARTRHSNQLNMSSILNSIALEFGGTGGGHTAAAGLNIKPCPSKNQQKKILLRFTTLVLDTINNNDVPVSD